MSEPPTNVIPGHSLTAADVDKEFAALKDSQIMKRRRQGGTDLLGGQRFADDTGGERQHQPGVSLSQTRQRFATLAC